MTCFCSRHLHDVLIDFTMGRVDIVVATGNHCHRSLRKLFRNCDFVTLCNFSTVAFGMGINRPDVRAILHWGWPQSLEQYFQVILYMHNMHACAISHARICRRLEGLVEMVPLPIVFCLST
jgi:hypothetical protein